MTAVLISTLYTRPNLTRGDEPLGGERLGGEGEEVSRSGKWGGFRDGGEDPEWGSDCG